MEIHITLEFIVFLVVACLFYNVLFYLNLGIDISQFLSSWWSHIHCDPDMIKKAVPLESVIDVAFVFYGTIPNPSMELWKIHTDYALCLVFHDAI